jgi:flavin reductase (DIM6/NTAB) family NADH-FMN oxidoreductase RutF
MQLAKSMAKRISLVSNEGSRQNRRSFFGVIMQNNHLSQMMKLGMRRLAAGVCVLSTRTDTGHPFAMTVSSVTSVSDNPASLLVCINKQVSQQEHLSTLGNQFAVNILSESQQAISDLCAGRDVGDRFSQGDWLENPQGIPYLADAQAVFFCKVDLASAYGTHHIVVGLMHEVLVSEAEPSPLIYVNGSYARLADAK